MEIDVALTACEVSKLPHERTVYHRFMLWRATLEWQRVIKLPYTDDNGVIRFATFAAMYEVQTCTRLPVSICNRGAADRRSGTVNQVPKMGAARTGGVCKRCAVDFARQVKISRLLLRHRSETLQESSVP